MRYLSILAPAAIFMLSTSSGLSYGGDARSYLEGMGQHLQDFYVPVPGTDSNTAVASFYLDRDGGTSDVTVLQSPAKFDRQASPADRAIKAAINNATPFPPPPAYFHCPLKLTVTFAGSQGDRPMTCSVETQGAAVAGTGMTVPY
jgi:hypothetical protein